MSTNDEIVLEEILLGYLRSSKYITLVSMDTKELDSKKEYVLKFDVSKEFGVTLCNPLDNKFMEFFNNNNKKNEH